MKRTKPQVTGLAIGLAVAVFGATSEASRKPLVAVLRWSAVGVGLGVATTHLLQRLDQSADSRRDYRSAKTRYLETLSEVAMRPPVQIFEKPPTAESEVDDLAWISAATETQVHFDEEAFDDEPMQRDESPVSDEKLPSAAQVIDPKVAFDTAMADGAWADAFEAYRIGGEQEPPIVPETAELVRLRQSAMAEIFHRMHSGTVRKDVAQLAQALVDSFPDSTEGRTLAQVLGVLRRSAGLCPRCAKPYTGIANACHDCLRGTPEAYQIAWDDDAAGQESPG